MAVTPAGARAAHRTGGLEPGRVRDDFPLLTRPRRGRRLVYLDSAASSQKPRAVIDAMTAYYERSHANVHRGVYSLAEEATSLYEGARARLARFLGAGSAAEIVFTKNVTEALNLVAFSWGRANLRPGDAVVLTIAEHHANIVPWLMLAEQRGIELRWIDITPTGELDLTDLDRLLDGARLLSVTAASNVLGTIPPVAELTRRAHDAGALVCVDGAQLAPHRPVDVRDLGCDFFGVTGHKMLGPTGIGALWARRELLEEMPAFLGGGEMIADVRTDGWTPNEVPHKFEAGTMPIAEAVGLAAALEYLEGLGMDAVAAHEAELTRYALRRLPEALDGRIRIFGPPDTDHRAGIISFELPGVHPHDVAQVLDQHNVCVRAGHHCAKPLMRRLGVPATARASVYVYNDTDDIDQLATGLLEALEMFGR